MESSAQSMAGDSYARNSQPDLHRIVIRHVAAVMLGMGLFCLFSDGVCFFSSSMVIAQAILWLKATASAEKLSVNKQRSLFDCAGGCYNCCTCRCLGDFDNLRGAAVSGIVFGSLEITVIVSVFVIMGRPFEGHFAAQSQWMLFAAGQVAVVAPLNIAISSLSLQLVQLLRVETSSNISMAASEGRFNTYGIASANAVTNHPLLRQSGMSKPMDATETSMSKDWDPRAIIST